MLRKVNDGMFAGQWIQPLYWWLDDNAMLGPDKTFRYNVTFADESGMLWSANEYELEPLYVHDMTPEPPLVLFTQLFTLDIPENTAFLGYYDPEQNNWNGWKRPWFNRTQIDGLIDALNEAGTVCRYVPGLDCVDIEVETTAWWPWEQQDYKGYPPTEITYERYYGIEFAGNKYYAVGNGVWCWMNGDAFQRIVNLEPNEAYIIDGAEYDFIDTQDLYEPENIDEIDEVNPMEFCPACSVVDHVSRLFAEVCEPIGHPHPHNLKPKHITAPMLANMINRALYMGDVIGKNIVCADVIGTQVEIVESVSL